MTVEKVGRLSSVKIVYNSFERSIFNSSFQVIKEHSDKLLNILLHHNVDFFSVGFVGFAKAIGNEIDSGGFFKMRKDPLNLMQKVVIDFSWDVFVHVFNDVWFNFIVNPKEEVSESFVHVKLL